MAQFTQANRSLSLETPLGTDAHLLQSFTGREAMSRLFVYHLETVSSNADIAPRDLVGQVVSWRIHQVDDEPRVFHGVVSRLFAGAVDRNGDRAYRIEVVPTLWFLTRTADCRIYQEMATPEIIKDVLRRFGLTDFEMRLNGTYAKRDYCVQYRETAFNFISRLMEQDGIFYFFEHEAGRHVLVFGDSGIAYAGAKEATVRFAPSTLVPNHVSSWEHQYEYRSGKWSLQDYNFETPSSSLLASTATGISLAGISALEIYDYPGDYLVRGAGEAYTKIRMEEEETPFNVVNGVSTCCTFSPGSLFTLEDHEVSSENGRYVITSIQHSASDSSYDSSAEGSSYGNTFTCVPRDVSYRPARLTPKPVVQGPQTAVVVGLAGEEIFVDKYGRIKVQFYWDRLGKRDQNSSCWVRVSQNWAGKNWGIVFHPRIGQEVVVDFLEGDPDRPLVTGRVYNAEQMPPYALPANMTQSGVLTRSTKGGSPTTCNELRFEDKKGSEQVFLHAEKNQDIEVENDETHWVGHDRKKTIDRDETSHIKRDRTETVDRDEKITIHGNRTEVVDKDETITIHQNRTETVDKDETITIHQNRTETVDKNETITIHQNRTETVDKDESTTINGGRTETVAKDESITINGGRTESVSKDESVTVGGGRTVSISKDDSLTVGKTLSITAADSITLTTGSASITMQKDGTITISGKDITINGSGEIVGKASKNMTLKGQKILQN